VPPRSLDNALLANASEPRERLKLLRLTLWAVLLALLSHFSTEAAAAAALLSLVATRRWCDDASLWAALAEEGALAVPCDDALPEPLAALVRAAGRAVSGVLTPRVEVTDLGLLLVARATWPTGSEALLLGIFGDWHCLARSRIRSRRVAEWLHRAAAAAERAARDAEQAVR